MDGMGQRPLYPPNVSGWKHNGYWVNASAMARRTDAARQFIWGSMRGFWNGDGLVDRMLELMGVTVSAGTRQALVTMSTQSSRWERTDLLHLILIAPDFHVA